jgi:peroxiredoxin
MNNRSKLTVAVATFCAARFAFALSPGETVDNFRLLDHQGGSRELYYLSDMKAVVLMAQGNSCDVSRQAVPGLKALRDQYRAQGVEVLLIDSNLTDTSTAIVKEATAAGIDMPILIDDTQLIGEALDLRVSRPAVEGRRCGRRPRQRAAGEDCEGRYQGLPRRDARTRQEGGAREDLVLEDDRADAHRQLCHVPSRRRHRSVGDDELRHGQGLRADDP